MVSSNFLTSSNILLVDGNNLLLRILFAKNKGSSTLSTPEIIQECAMIFMHQLGIYTKKYSCENVYVFFDCGGSLRKKAIFEEYKQNRQYGATTGYNAAFNDPNTNLFMELKDKTIQLIRLFNIPVFHEYGIEADDIIGIATEELVKLGKHIIILSNDSDFLQLLNSGNVTCCIPSKKVDIDRNNFTDFFSSLPKSKGVSISCFEYLFYKSLVGDTSDNIDGIPKLGYKTLFKLMEAQLLLDSQDAHKMYVTDTLDYVKHLSDKNTSKLEKLVHENIDLIIRNYKLIELSERFASPHTTQLALKKLLERYSQPSRKDLIKGFHKLFPGSPQIEFLLNLLFILKKIYVSDTE